jgi:hypothetical protein
MYGGLAVVSDTFNGTYVIQGDTSVQWRAGGYANFPPVIRYKLNDRGDGVEDVDLTSLTQR